MCRNERDTHILSVFLLKWTRMNALNSAFPTLSSNANEPPKSFFDVEGATSIVSNVVYALYPINEV